MKRHAHRYYFSHPLLVSCFFCLLAGVAVPNAKAQDGTVLPDSLQSQADPSRAVQQLFPVERQDKIPPPPVATASSVTAPPAGADMIVFTLQAIVLRDNTVLSAADIKSVIALYQGKAVSLADLYLMADQLTAQYRAKGYVLSRVMVPPQDIVDGKAQLQAIEGKLGQVAIDAPDGYKTKLLKAYTKALVIGKPLNMNQLERALLLLNDLPGMQMRAVLSPSGQEGVTDLTLKVAEERFDGYVAANNYGSTYLGPYQLGAGLNINNWRGGHEQLGIQAGIAPYGTDKPELGYLGISYTEPVGRHGTVFETLTSYSLTEPGDDLRAFNVTGYSEYAALGLRHPFIRSRDLNLSVYLGADARNAITENDLDGGREDRIRALRARLHLDGIDTEWGLAWNSLDLELSKGLETLGSSLAGDPFLTRSEGQPDFWKLNIEASRLQPLTTSLNLLTGIKGQLAGSALLSSEEMAFGGMGEGYGRGYDPAEITGDDALGGKVELQWDVGQYAPAKLRNDGRYQLYGFYDAGLVWNQDATDPTLKRRSLASLGAGMRASLNDKLHADFTAAKPLTRVVDAEDDKSPRFFFALSRQF